MDFNLFNHIHLVNLFTHVHLVTAEELNVGKGHYNHNSNNMYTAILNIIHTVTFALSF